MTASERIREARSLQETRNYYGQPITDAALYDDAHTVNAVSAGLPPVCSCGWTPHGEFTMADHIADMGEFA